MKPKWNHYGGCFMTSITIKNLPPAIYERIKEQAKVNRRSLNNEIIIMLERGTGIRSQADLAELLENARKLRELTANYGLTDDEINKTIQPAQTAETLLLSEPALAKDWDRPEEEAAWAHLQPGTTETDTQSKEKNKYPLRGKPVIYHEPFKGVAEDEWEASK
jgi:antitoxin FitA